MQASASGARALPLLLSLAVFGQCPQSGADNFAALQRMTVWDRSVYEHGIRIRYPEPHAVFFRKHGSTDLRVQIGLEAVAPAIAALDLVECYALHVPASGFPKVERARVLTKGSIVGADGQFTIEVQARIQGMVLIECYVAESKTAAWGVTVFHLSSSAEYAHRPFLGAEGSELDLIVYKPWRGITRSEVVAQHALQHATYTTQHAASGKRQAAICSTPPCRNSNIRCVARLCGPPHPHQNWARPLPHVPDP